MKVFLTLFLLLTSVSSAAMLNLTAPPQFVVSNYYVGLASSNFGEVMCMDFDRQTTIPSSFEVLVYSPTTPQEIQAAILFTTFLSTPAPLRTSYISAVFQHAVWNAKDLSFPDYGTSGAALSLAELLQSNNSFDVSSVVILSDPTGVNQRFLALRGEDLPTDNQVPEPMTLGVVGLVLVVMGIRKYK